MLAITLCIAVINHATYFGLQKPLYNEGSTRMIRKVHEMNCWIPKCHVLTLIAYILVESKVKL